ncbi:uncharacterized protein FIBRA_01758 [Fibroporia radiculosa]|uniref:Uncharacterized protein n=1 Tax=Fibroporia radiculosa TaxID=599839 RepID=J4I8N8_9APHY|nr:uncharacterized protein FIBRA_01758 [Fibroporia radiculosa]CCL99736.1 predicted protein [Fibroporia radiculosa]
MPDLTIINNLNEDIHVAFSICAPTHWKNHLKPNERWTTHLPTMPLYFQVRWAQRKDDEHGIVYWSREFSPQESWDTGATIGIACAAGTASVLSAAACTLTGMGAVGGVVAAPLMSLACAGGNNYAAIGSDSKLYETRVWVPWFEHKEYSVRNVGEGRCVLWDVRENKQV